MMASELEIRKAEIGSILGDLEHYHGWFKSRGIDINDPGDREAFDIISRIERRILSSSPASTRKQD